MDFYASSRIVIVKKKLFYHYPGACPLWSRHRDDAFHVRKK
jgi:hypothetical protein